MTTMDENDLFLMLGRMEGKLDSALVRLEKLEALEKRVDALERSRAWLIGAATAISAAFSAIFAFLTQK